MQLLFALSVVSAFNPMMNFGKRETGFANSLFGIPSSGATGFFSRVSRDPDYKALQDYLSYDNY